MASSRIYDHIGVLLPIERDDNPRVLHDARVLPNDEFMKDGFLFVRALQMGNDRYDDQGQRRRGRIFNPGQIVRDQSIFVVQSVSTGELFANKLLEANWDTVTRLSLPPPELRVSTYKPPIGDPNIDNLNLPDTDRKGVLPDVPYFNQLRWWQEMDPQDVDNPNCTVYSIFYEFCNGGTLQQLMESYNERTIATPEHFIWLVAEQLFLALVTMNFGTYPAGDGGGNNQPDNWARVYHRDLHAANVFINYPPRGPGRIPKAGIEGNAFPEIVIGDFGASGIEGDDPANIRQPSVFGIQAFEVWEDIYSVGEILREMSMTHVPNAGGLDVRPADRWVQDVNQLQTAPPYSAALIGLLQRFEYPGMIGGGLGGPVGLGDARHTTFPRPEDIRDNLLPQVQARVQGFRRPANRPAGYYDTMDVSWTKPGELRPLNYVMRYAAEAGDGPDGGPPSDHDSSSGDSEGDQDSPSPSEAAQDDSAPPSGSPQPPDNSEGSSGPDDGSHDGDDNHDDDDNNDDDDGTPVDPFPGPARRSPEVSTERRAMRDLRQLHKWNGAKPRYVLRALQYQVPVMLPFKFPP